MRDLDIQTLLIDYIEGELPEAEAKRIRSMLDENPEIARLHDELRLVLDTAADPGELNPPAGWDDHFYTRLSARMREEGLDPSLPPAEPLRARLSQWLVAGSPLRGLVRIAAAVVLVNLVAWTAIRLLGPTVPDPAVGGAIGDESGWTDLADAAAVMEVTVPSLSDEAVDSLSSRLLAELAEDLADADLDNLPLRVSHPDDYTDGLEDLTDEQAVALYEAIGEMLPDAYSAQAG